MAQKVNVLLLDDLDGGEADETVLFSIDGVSYEIDLSRKNALEFRDTLGKYQSAARRRKPGRGASKSQSGKKVDYKRSSEIRAWAKAKGYKVSERGRISTEIAQKYEEATGQ